MKTNMLNKEKLKKFKPVLIGLGIAVLFLIELMAAFITVQISQAPDISEVDATPDGYLTVILDKDENVMERLSVSESNRIYVKLEEIPEDLQDAFVAIEDERFYRHNGIDIKGIFRAAWKGISSGSFSQGASTITQQLLKNNVLTDWMEEETFYDRVCRKIQEQYLAVRLEQEYSKKWILENYLNTINLGGGTRGVQVAAEYYFDKDVSELTLAQCALIAGITKNPSAYNPMKNPEKSVERQQLVLKAMLEQGYITEEEYEQAALENVITKLNTDSANAGAQIFSWFEDALLQQIVADLTEEYTYNEEEAWDLIYSGGLKIYSTQDTVLQEICENAAANPDWYADNEEISVVMTDVSTGAVAAIVGGREAKTSSLVYNRATDSIRQPGSTVKVIGEYAAALEANEITLGTVLDDAPYTYSDGTNLRNSYSTYKGMTTIRDAIASSSNVVALKAFQLVGGETVYEYLQKFGLTTLTEADVHEALAIGGTYNGVTNLELTAAYNVIANSGRYVQPYFYTKVVDQDGKIILERGTSQEQVISKESAELLTAAMEDVITSGTGKDAVVEGITLAGKSGTTNSNKDIWFVGFSSYYTCGIWGGYDDNFAQENSSYVKKIWQNIMEEAHQDKKDIPLVDEDNLTSVNICKKCGQKAVKGLCEDTLQGNMTIKEYYVKGTQPTKTCDCHVRITICQDSQMSAGSFCPTDAKITGIYLRTGTEGTEDSKYIVPKNAEKSCDIHTSFWDKWMSSEEEEQKDPGRPENPGENTGDGDGDDGNWFDNIFGSLFGG